MKKLKEILGVILALAVIGAIGNLVNPDSSSDASSPRSPGATRAVLSAANDQSAKTTKRTVTQTPTSRPTNKPTATPISALVYEALERGDKGDDVEDLQVRLNDLGSPVGSADGIYGGKTESAIKSFQKQAGLTATG